MFWYLCVICVQFLVTRIFNGQTVVLNSREQFLVIYLITVQASEAMRLNFSKKIFELFHLNCLRLNNLI